MGLLHTALSSVDVTGVIIFLLVFLLGYCLLTMPKNLPPGPPGLPIVGNMLDILIPFQNLVILVHQWRAKYGGICTVRLGSQYVFFLNTYKLGQEAFVKQGDIFSSRPLHLHTIKTMCENTGSGVIFSDGPMWKSLRRVTLMTLRDFGVGKKSLEQRVQDEAYAIVEALDKSKGQPLILKQHLSKFSANIICSVIFGNRFDYEDATFIELTRCVNEALKAPIAFQPANFLPFYRKFPPVQKTLKHFLNQFLAVDSFLEEILKEHEKTFDPDDVRDFVDLYIKTRLESEDAHLYNAANMRRVIIDLFFAGTETSSSTVDWIILHMVRFPEVQTRCQNAIDKVVGQNRAVTTEDRKNLPYIDAVIVEVMRSAPVAPLGISHYAMREGQVGKYTIPKGSILLLNIWEIHHDPEAWPEPEVFKPERFLDDNGQFQQPRESYCPFGIGPRVCLGEMLARMEVFLLFTTLLQFFTFSMPQGHQPDLQGQFTGLYTTKEQVVIAKRR